MITADTSPLTFPVRMDPIPAAIPPGATLTELLAWLHQHGLDPADQPIDLDRGIRIGLAELTFWHPTNTDTPPRKIVRPLRSHPSTGMLAELAAARVLLCTSTHLVAARAGDWPEQIDAFYECDVPVDDRGQHAGPHHDSRHTSRDAAWPNTDTPAGIPDMSYLLDGTIPITGFVTAKPADLAPAPMITLEAMKEAMRRISETRQAAAPTFFKFTPPLDLVPDLGTPHFLITVDLADKPGAQVTVWEHTDTGYRQHQGARVVDATWPPELPDTPEPPQHPTGEPS